MILIILLLYIIFIPYTFLLSEEGFNENLFIGSLANDDIITIFNFTILTQQDNKVSSNSSYIPWLFLHLFEQFSLDNFKLSISQGFWRTNLWGYQNLNTEVPSGTELSVKFSNKAINTSQKWHDFVHLINGLFCSSILGLLPQLSVQPKLVNGWWYGSLGGESVCTENLQSWKKLLPCKQSGLVALLKPTFLLSTRFHSISVQMNKEIKNGNLDVFHLKFISKTVYNYKSIIKQDREFSFERLFNSKFFIRCPVSFQSQILIENKSFKNFDIHLPISFMANRLENSNLLLVNLNNDTTFNLNEIRFMPKDLKANNHHYINPPTILMHTFLKSVSQFGGHIYTQIKNPILFSINARFMQMIPWQIRVFLHSLTFVCFTSSNEINQFFGEYSLARDRKKPLLIELNILLPANSTCKIEFEFEAAFLRFSEFPPDANSGIYLPGAVLLFSEVDSPIHSIFSTSINKTSNKKMYGEPLLILLPVPDFSMPFNVICFVCTIIAVFYGNIFAFSTKLMKLFVKEDEHLKVIEQKTRRTFKEKIFNLFSF